MNRLRTRALLGASLETLGVAAEALARYKLRTSLSILGVVLGVAAVIAMMSVSEGARREALRQVESLGIDNLVARNRGLTASQGGASTGLTVADAEHLLRLVPEAELVSPLLERVAPISSAGTSVIATVIGVRPTYQAILRLQLARGRFLSTIDDTRGSGVSVLGSALARQLFGHSDPVGQFVRVRNEYFKVVGVLSERGTQSLAPGALAWRDLNAAALVPLAALSGRGIGVAPGQPVNEIWLRAGDEDHVEAIGQVVETALQRLHNGRPDVDVVVPRELLAQRYRTQQTFSVVVGSIAAIALLIGGIGIMNIMLTSVVERTHEIGIRRTVGATRRHVTIQFLTESLLMTISGGLIGIVAGVGIALGITSYAGWSTHVSPLAVLLAVGVSLVVGLVFGIYPAVTAANLEPVDAVRYE